MGDCPPPHWQPSIAVTIVQSVINVFTWLINSLSLSLFWPWAVVIKAELLAEIAAVLTNNNQRFITLHSINAGLNTTAVGYYGYRLT